MEQMGEPPEVLVGYCVGARIAVQLAARLEGVHGSSLTVVVIDPAEVTDQSVREEADVLLSRMGVIAPVAGAGSDLGEIVAELNDAFGTYLAAGDPDDREMLEGMRAETLDRYAAWLAFIAAAAGRVEPGLASMIHVLLSVEGAEVELPSWLEAPASVAHLGVGRDELLASAEAAERLFAIAGATGS
jgi:pimeloyl-ACP methyl ester carboxylesterase